MHPVRLPAFAVAFAFFCISGCSTITPGPTEPVPPPLPEPALIESLPENVQSFELRGYKYFQDGSGGYSLQYANDRKRRTADVYIYPVAEENSNLEHNQLVLGSTRATLEAIGAAAQQGHYDNFNVINAGTQARGLRTVARVQATYLRQNLASFTLVYQTEHAGTLLKIRVSMPDNESNRVSGEWDLFAEKIFETIIEDLEQAATI